MGSGLFSPNPAFGIGWELSVGIILMNKERKGRLREMGSYLT